MPRYLLFLSCMLMSFAGFCQDSLLLCTYQLPANITAADFDAEGNIYIALTDGSLRKFDASGKESCRYAPAGLPNFQQLYAFNRLQIIAFDADARRVYFLDRFLREQGQYQLPAKATMISQLAPANRSSFWLLDMSSRELHLWDYQNQQIIFSRPWSSYISGNEDFVPLVLTSLGQQLALLSNTGQLLLLDQQGDFRTYFTDAAITAIDLLPEKLWALAGNVVWEYDAVAARRQLFRLSETVDGVAAGEKQLFCWKGKKGWLYLLPEVQPEN